MQIDNSALRTYTDCNRKAMFAHVLHRQPRKEGEAAWFGQQFHKFVQHYLQPGDKWKEIAIEYEQRLEFFQQKQEKEGRFFQREDLKPEVYLNCIRQFVQQVPRMISRYENEVLLLDPKSKQPIWIIKHRPEIGIQFPLAGDEYTGRLDFIAEDFNDVVYIFDVKTTGEYRRDKSTGEAVPRDGWIEQFRMSTQFTGYIEALTHHTSKPIGGAVILAIPRVKDKLRVMQILVRRTQQELDEWKAHTAWLITQYKADKLLALQGELNKIVPTGKYNGACTRFGICPYFDVCKSHCNPSVLEMLTIHKEWKPLEDEEEN